jgi:hypothetical protein
MTEMKTCTKCREEKKLDTFYKNNKSKDGLTSSCSVCNIAAEKTRQDKLRARTSIVSPSEKVCPSCNVVKPQKSFGFKKACRDGLQHACRECSQAEKGARYTRLNKEGRTIISQLKARYEGNSCVDCGVVHPYFVCDFDHRLGREKSFEIASKGALLATTERMTEVYAEIAKCDYVCKNCHAVRTQLRNTARRLQRDAYKAA